MRKVIRDCDQFGVMFSFKGFNQDSQFKSLYGGMVSILIWVTIAMYFLYMMVIWQTKLIPPTVNTKIEYEPDGFYMNLTYPLFILSIENNDDDNELRQIAKQGKLFDYNTHYYGFNGSVDKLLKIPEEYDCGIGQTKIDYFQPICLNLEENKQQWLYQDSQKINDVYFQFQVTRCDQELDSSCLSRKDQSRFAESDTSWRLTIAIQEVDLQTGKINTIPTDYYFPFNYGKQPYVQLKVSKGKVLIDEGVIFPNIREVEIVKGISLETSDAPQDISGPLLSISMERYYYEVKIRYVKVGEILANVSSVLQTLLLWGYLVTRLNSGLLERKVKEYLIHIYFPQYGNYNISYDWRNRVKSITRLGQILDESQSNRFLRFRETIFKALELQFNQINLLNQINKLQLCIQLLMPRKLTKQIKDINYTIHDELWYNHLLNSKQPSTDTLDEKDFLTMQNRIGFSTQVHNFSQDDLSSTRINEDNAYDPFTEKVASKVANNIVQRQMFNLNEENNKIKFKGRSLSIIERDH